MIANEKQAIEALHRALDFCAADPIRMTPPAKYDEVEDYLHYHRGRFEQIARRVWQTPIGKWIDIGCGSLHLPMAYAAWGHDVTAVDLPYELEVGEIRPHFERRLDHSGIRFQAVRTYAEPLPFEDAAFDTLSCCETLEHLISDPFYVVGEWRRVLKPAGRLIVSVPNILRFRRLMSMLCLRGFPPTLKEMRGQNMLSIHFKEYMKWELLHLISESGFRVESFCYYSGEAKPPAGSNFIAASPLVWGVKRAIETVVPPLRENLLVLAVRN